MELLLEEEVGESSSPPRPYGFPSPHDIRNDIYYKLMEDGNEDAVSNPDFKRQLDAHFNRLPYSYLLDVNVDKAEDVVLHQKILAKARDPGKRPVFHCRFMQLEDLNLEVKGNAEDSEDKRLLTEASSTRQNFVQNPVHEIIFSTVDRPKLLSQLSALLSDVGLNIREAHVFSTIDGYSLDVFVVDGWPDEGTDGLDKVLEQAIVRSEVLVDYIFFSCCIL
uniref:[Protein-PII] uridylyltransferase n=1 Tax=Anthurium amnicola TaxID=1678845 RepID=A0A1D1XY98_9ARAE